MKGYRGVPKLFHQAYKKNGVLKHTSTWYADIWKNGKMVRMALGPDKTKATTLLKKLLPLSLDPLTMRLSDLLRMVREHYLVNARKSNPEPRIKHLESFFRGDPLVSDLTTPVLRSYQAYRIGQGIKPGTINVELAMLSLGLNLAEVRDKPRIPRLVENNARKGFFEKADLEAVLSHLPEDYHALVWTAYYTGWRPKTELMTRQWRHVDFDSGWLRLDPGESKNKEGRNFPLIPPLKAVLEAQRTRCDALEGKLGRVIPWLFFFQNGERLSYYHFAWDKARKAAGQPNRLMYDLRRTAVRNLERAGVPRSAAMSLVGHRTQAMYQRYAISDQALLTHAGDLLAEFHSDLPGTPVVVAFKK